MANALLEELQRAGLLDQSSRPQLTSKGRHWLRQLEDLETQEVVDAGESNMDFIQSTNGLFR